KPLSRLDLQSPSGMGGPAANGPNQIQKPPPGEPRHPKAKLPMSAALIEGAKAILSRPSPRRPSTHFNLIAAVCTVANSNSSNENGSAQRSPTHRNATVNSFTSPPPSHPLA